MWAHFKVLIDLRVEQELRKKPRSDRQLEFLPEEYWQQCDAALTSPKDVFENLEAHPNQSIRKQCNETFHLFQKSIILDDINELLNTVKELMGSDNAHLTRFMAHIVLFLRTLGMQTQEDVCIEVLNKYVEVLIHHKQHELVAMYTAQLPPDLQVDVYAKFLEDITDKVDKEKFLRLGEEAGLNLQLITTRVVENIRGKGDTMGEALPSGLLEISETDQRKIASVEWLTYDETQRCEALKQANAIARGFLAEKKLDACERLLSQLPTDSIQVVHVNWQKSAGNTPLPAEHENIIKEYLCLRTYLDAHDAFNNWFEHFHHRVPTEPKKCENRTFKEQIEFEQIAKDYDMEFDRWQKTLTTHVKVTSDRIYNVLLFPDGWMVDTRAELKEADKQRAHQLTLIRQLCIPYLAFLLHNVLHSAKQYKQCLQLAEVIQSKRQNLHSAFQKFELQKLLQLTRDSSIALLDQGLDPFGYEKK